MLTAECRQWFDQHAVALESVDPESPLSAAERGILNRIIGKSAVIGLGEITHGSKEIFRAKDRFLRHLIRHCDVTGIVLEANFASTTAINNFVLTRQGCVREALTATGFFSCANHETLAFVRWLAEYNASLPPSATPIRILGCDLQSVDDPRKQLSKFLADPQVATLAEETELKRIRILLDNLPDDQQLSCRIEAILTEFDRPEFDRPMFDQQRIAHLQREQLNLVTQLRPQVEEVLQFLKQMAIAQAEARPRDELFRMTLNGRALQQAIDNYAFDDGGRPRDRFMADNVQALRQHYPGERFVLTSGNWHISRVAIPIADTEDYVTMGSILAEQLGDDYRAIGSAFHRGKYLGVAGESAGQDVIVESHVPRNDAFEDLLNRYASATLSPDLLVEFRDSRREGAGFPWPASLPMHVGEARAKQPYEVTFLPQRPQLQFDGLFYVAASTPITILSEYYEYAQAKWGKRKDLSSESERSASSRSQTSSSLQPDH